MQVYKVWKGPRDVWEVKPSEVVSTFRTVIVDDNSWTLSKGQISSSFIRRVAQARTSMGNQIAKYVSEEDLLQEPEEEEEGEVDAAAVVEGDLISDEEDTGMGVSVGTAASAGIKRNADEAEIADDRTIKGLRLQVSSNPSWSPEV